MDVKAGGKAVFGVSAKLLLLVSYIILFSNQLFFLWLLNVDALCANV